MTLLRQDMPANYCALTFDDGPGPYTAALLDVLLARGIVATFFVVGQNVERRPALIARMLAEGHEVANHSYSHANMRRLQPASQALEMKKTQDALRALGVEARYFRPPYGNYTRELVEQAEALGMTTVLWSLDSQDWKRRVSRLEGLRSVSPTVQQSFPGMRGVFLFHDTHKRTVDEMAAILDTLLVDGCERFVTMTEYMATVPRDEERRLSAKAPGKGRGAMPPPSRAGQRPIPPADELASRPAEEARDRKIPVMSMLNMRTQPAHSVQAQHDANMGTQPAHSVQAQHDANMGTQPAHIVQARRDVNIWIQPAHGLPDRALPVLSPETLMMGIVTSEQAMPAAQGTLPGNPAPLSERPAASQARDSPAAQGRILRLLSDPDLILPAHKQNRDKQAIKRRGSDPG